MAKDSNGKDRDLKKRIENDYYFSCAIEECYASCKNIINDLVQGEPEKRYFSYICVMSPRLYLLNLGRNSTFDPRCT
jgi:callose synthase